MHSYNKNPTPKKKKEKAREILETLGGDVKAKPHSTKLGRIFSGIRKLGRMTKTSKKN